MWTRKILGLDRLEMIEREGSSVEEGVNWGAIDWLRRRGRGGVSEERVCCFVGKMRCRQRNGVNSLVFLIVVWNINKGSERAGTFFKQRQNDSTLLLFINGSGHLRYTRLITIIKSKSSPSSCSISLSVSSPSSKSPH